MFQQSISIGNRPDQSPCLKLIKFGYQTYIVSLSSKLTKQSAIDLISPAASTVMGIVYITFACQVP